MEYETLVGLSGDPVVEGDLVRPVGRSGAKQAVQVLSGSLTTQLQGDVPYPADASRPMQSHDQEAREHDLSRMTATHDSHYLKNGHDTSLGFAKARQHPQKTHALATSCPVCTCVHRWWC